jgi:hypothetical protein
MSGVAIVREAAIGEVCAGVPKSALRSALVPPIGGFEPALLAGLRERELRLLKAIKTAILAAKPLESGECRLKGRSGQTDETPGEG